MLPSTPVYYCKISQSSMNSQTPDETEGQLFSFLCHLDLCKRGSSDQLRSAGSADPTSHHLSGTAHVMGGWQAAGAPATGQRSLRPEHHFKRQA